MNKKIENPYVFPSTIRDSYTGEITTGITLRDYFAAKVLQGFISDPTYNPDNYFETLAKNSYKMADSMLKQR